MFTAQTYYSPTERLLFSPPPPHNNFPCNVSPLAAKPEEPPRHSKRSGFWDAFATNWAAKKQAEAAAVAAAANEAAVAGEGGVQEVEEAAAAGGEEVQDGRMTEGEEGEEVEGEGGGQSGNNSFSKYISLGGRSEEVSLKWNFVTSKLAEMKAKSN